MPILVLGAGDANGADEELHLCLLTGEDVLDECAGFRSPAIGPQRRIADRLLLANVGDVAVPLQPLFVLLRAMAVSAQTVEPVLPRLSTLRSWAPS